MSRWWILPACPAAFWAGLLGSGARPLGVTGPLLLGGALVVGSLAAGRVDRSGDRPLLREAGLLQPESLEPRERILAAAGFPVGGTPSSRREWSIHGAAALLLGVALLGVGWGGARAWSTRPPPGLVGRFVRFEGVAVGDARPSAFGWSLEAHLNLVEVDAVARPEDLRVWLQGSDRPPHVEAGARLTGSGSLAAIPPARDDFGAYLRARGVEATLDAEDVRVVGPATNPLLRLANATRASLRRGAELVLPPREAGLLLGLSIGDTSTMDPEVEEDFRATGLGHLLAVSGSNVAMFLVPVLSLLTLLRVRRTGRLVLGVGAVAFFVLLTRWEPSVLRAGAMAGLALAGVWAGRPRSTGALLGTSVLALLVFDPGLATAVGFQLSVAATAGLALMASPLAARLRWMPRPLALAVAATLAAQLAVTPLLLLLFGVVPTVTVLANVLAFPAVPPALLFGLVASSAAVVWPGAGHALAGPARLPLVYLVGVADTMARFSLPSVTAGDALVPAVASLLIALVAWRLKRRRGPAGRAVAAATIALVAWSAVPRAGPPSSLEITFFDVGQGDAAVIRTPEGGSVLIDAGPEPDRVAVDLAALGVRRIDLAVGTHAHADHLEGFPAILARFPVSLLIEPGCPGDSPSYRRFLEAAASEEVPVRHPRGGARLAVGALVVEVLGPDACSGEPNDDSLVLRLSYHGATLLFPGDAEVAAQEDLLQDGDPLEAVVLKVPHHGGDTSSSEFLDATDAAVGVVSTGPNTYGHPVPSVLAELRSLGMRVLRTDVRGDVTVRLDGRALVIESERG